MGIRIARSGRREFNARAPGNVGGGAGGDFYAELKEGERSLMSQANALLGGTRAYLLGCFPYDFPIGELEKFKCKWVGPHFLLCFAKGLSIVRKSRIAPSGKSIRCEWNATGQFAEMVRKTRHPSMGAASDDLVFER